jgi:hypothetical protein
LKAGGEERRTKTLEDTIFSREKGDWKVRKGGWKLEKEAGS